MFALRMFATFCLAPATEIRIYILKNTELSYLHIFCFFCCVATCGENAKIPSPHCIPRCDIKYLTSMSATNVTLKKVRGLY